MEKIKTEDCSPRADIMLENMRSMGYDLNTAVADIIDNSISAFAKTIKIDCVWAGEASTIVISDDGRGMNGSKISEAMRLGSFRLDDKRQDGDLGRFGLGLKTASLSQSRRFTVVSKEKDYHPVYRCWSLDHVVQTKKWELLYSKPDCLRMEIVDDSISGTWVIWEQLDRLTTGTNLENPVHEQTWSGQIAELCDHISMVFHRYIESKSINILLNGKQLIAWDPFLAGEPATIIQPETALNNDQIKLKPYILPHQSKLSPENFKSAAGVKGWNAQQGFYIYRNKRLIIAGGWLGLFALEEHCKLARILVDLPNTDDFDWQIDIRKAKAKLPKKYVKEFKRIATSARNQAKKVHAGKGRILQRTTNLGYIPVWNFKVRNGKHSYVVNREHPAVEMFLSDLSIVNLSKSKFINLINLIEECIPVAAISMKETEEPEKAHQLLDMDELKVKEIFNQIIQSRKNQSYSLEETKRFMSNLEPFDHFPHLIDLII